MVVLVVVVVLVGIVVSVSNLEYSCLFNKKPRIPWIYKAVWLQKNQFFRFWILIVCIFSMKKIHFFSLHDTQRFLSFCLLIIYVLCKVTTNQYESAFNYTIDYLNWLYRKCFIIVIYLGLFFLHLAAVFSISSWHWFTILLFLVFLLEI